MTFNSMATAVRSGLFLIAPSETPLPRARCAQDSPARRPCACTPFATAFAAATQQRTKTKQHQWLLSAWPEHHCQHFAHTTLHSLARGEGVPAGRACYGLPPQPLLGPALPGALGTEAQLAYAYGIIVSPRFLLGEKRSRVLHYRTQQLATLGTRTLSERLVIASEPAFLFR